MQLYVVCLPDNTMGSKRFRNRIGDFSNLQILRNTEDPHIHGFSKLKAGWVSAGSVLGVHCESAGSPLGVR